MNRFKPKHHPSSRSAKV